MTGKAKTVMFFATGFYSGYVPVAPGTCGTLVGLPFCFLLSGLDFWIAFGLTVLLILLAMGIAHMAERVLRQRDPGCIVIDEIAGIAVTFVGIAMTPFTAVAGFILFRVMDIAKPFPVRLAEKTVPGGAGVVLDDLLAGIYANLLLRLVLLVKESLW
jgi:phosphatidylglycerophosphatase A